MDPDSEQESPPLVLEYAKPAEPVSFRRVIAGVVGIASGLVAIPLLVIACLSLLEDLDPGPSRPRGDVIGGHIFALCFVIVLALVSWVWICYAFRIGPGRARKVL